MKVNILGTEYTIEEHTVEEDSYLENCDGYCDKSTKEIVVSKQKPDNDLSDYEWYRKKVMRHEIIHAFLYESGLDVCFKHADRYGHEETMVDWIAMQFPKILKVYEEVGCL